MDLAVPAHQAPILPEMPLASLNLTKPLTPETASSLNLARLEEGHHSHPNVKAWYVDDDGYYYYQYDPDYNSNDYYDPHSEDSSDFQADSLLEGLPNYDSSQAGSSFLDEIYYYRYIINIVVLAIPWSLFAIGMIVYNFWFNIEYNDIWAGGNFWLILNSVYLVVQALVSIFDAFELPIFLLSFRVLRLFSVVLSVIYTVLFIISIVEWYSQLYIVMDKSKYDFFTVYVNMMIGYNAIIHWSILPVNIFIIIKEISMEFFTFLTGSNYALGSKDLDYAGKDVVSAVNPLTWIDKIWELIFGYDVEDYVVENPDKEAEYYQNWGKN
mmetsp:Transcript_35909/g.55134  ORF Transcript_35909/g.55134 Transcript_35909/m.55134 type:complete len:325 (-) Transcript_35909:60-1034(-)